jgi:hypothetical protein
MCPTLLDLPIVHVLRRLRLIGELQPSRAAEALADLRDLPVVRYRTTPRMWRSPRLSMPRSSRATAAWLQRMGTTQGSNWLNSVTHTEAPQSDPR